MCRYFAETSATLFTTILGQREGVDALGGPFRDYWLSDGTYGSFRIQVGGGRLLVGCCQFLFGVSWLVCWSLSRIYDLVSVCLTRSYIAAAIIHCSSNHTLQQRNVIRLGVGCACNIQLW